MLTKTFPRSLAFAVALAGGTLGLDGSASAAATSSDYFAATKNVTSDGAPGAQLHQGACRIKAKANALTGTPWSNYFVGALSVPGKAIQHRARSVVYVGGILDGLYVYVKNSDCSELRNDWVHGLLARIESEVRPRAIAAETAKPGAAPGIAQCTWPSEGAPIDKSKPPTMEGSRCRATVTYTKSECPGLSTHKLRMVEGFAEIGKAVNVGSSSIRFEFEHSCETARQGKEEQAYCSDVRAKAQADGFMVESKEAKSLYGCSVPSCCTKPESIPAGTFDCGLVRYKTKQKDATGALCH